jgi:hypothetical protein
LFFDKNITTGTKRLAEGTHPRAMDPWRLGSQPRGAAHAPLVATPGSSHLVLWSADVTAWAIESWLQRVQRCWILVAEGPNWITVKDMAKVVGSWWQQGLIGLWIMVRWEALPTIVVFLLLDRGVWESGPNAIRSCYIKAHAPGRTQHQIECSILGPNAILGLAHVGFQSNFGSQHLIWAARLMRRHPFWVAHLMRNERAAPIMRD